MIQNYGRTQKIKTSMNFRRQISPQKTETDLMITFKSRNGVVQEIVSARTLCALLEAKTKLLE